MNRKELTWYFVLQQAREGHWRVKMLVYDLELVNRVVARSQTLMRTVSVPPGADLPSVETVEAAANGDQLPTMQLKSLGADWSDVQRGGRMS